ncbi:glycosyltransferase family 4 protein [Runella limosa]|uniref:glycosyltransferase family 4 protein n=1 Tax=Runella limosa TaxID=370978 RepID=UPI00040A4C50|nr:glycosyltransferase [Runella limosa]
MVSIACSTKFHAFFLANELDKHGLLETIHTSFHSQKNTYLNKLHHRKDKEDISVERIKTYPHIAFLLKLYPKYTYQINDLFDFQVSKNLLKGNETKVFIGWSSMSLRSIKASQQKNIVTILERGSSHMSFQNNLIAEEYQLILNKTQYTDPKIVNKELKEYEEADYISIPSTFVKKTFLQFGIPEKKLILNPYGAGEHFQYFPRQNQKLRILYFGALSVRKGVIYLFQALKNLKIPKSEYEVWFIGGIDEEIKSLYNKYVENNWKHYGHLNHYELNNYLNQCDLGVFPTIEDGFGMVINQMLICGIPVITTPNSGGPDVIKEGKSGFIVPIRDHISIQEKILHMYQNRDKLRQMQDYAARSASNNLSWSDYGNRYSHFIKQII